MSEVKLLQYVHTQIDTDEKGQKRKQKKNATSFYEVQEQAAIYIMRILLTERIKSDLRRRV